MKTTRKKIVNKLFHPKTYIPIILLVLLLATPLLIKNPFYQDLLIMMLFYATLSSAWNLIGGFAGQISLGHTAFFGIGAYTSTLLYLNFNLSPWLGMLVGAGLAVVVGIGIGYPCFRLKSHFFALSTIAFAEVLRLLASYWRGLTKGGVGLLIPFQPRARNFMFQGKLPYIYIALVLMLAVTLISYMIKRSRLGFYLVGLREDQDAAESLGVNTSRCKLFALIISVFFTALAGTFYAQYLLFIDPDTVFSLSLSIDIALFSIIGGVGTIVGPILGSFILTPLDILLRGWLGPLYAGLNFIIYGTVLIIAVIYFPWGIMNWLSKKYELIIDKLPGNNLSLDADVRKVSLSSKVLKVPVPDLTKDKPVIFEVKGLTKHFGGLAAVKNVDFQIRQGEILGLIGPNGAGKTTIFNLVSGFLSPDSGEVKFKGERITGLKPAHRISVRRMGRTFQLVKPFNNMTVFENLMVGAFCRTRERGKAEQKAREMLNFTGLWKYRDFLATNLTIASRKRLELCRALATEPELLLLDEVMAGLNPKETEEIIKLIRKISQQGVTLFVIEHVMKAIMSLSDRIIVLNYGEKIAEGTPMEISKNKKVIDAYLGKELKEEKEQSTETLGGKKQQMLPVARGTLLKLDNINTYYGDLQALHNVSFKVEEGEIVSIVGSNGAGKSTTLNTISGVFRPSSGAIKFKGKRIENFSFYHIVEMGLVQIPEARRLFPYMTVLENLDLGANPREGSSSIRSFGLAIIPRATANICCSPPLNVPAN